MPPATRRNLENGRCRPVVLQLWLKAHKHHEVCRSAPCSCGAGEAGFLSSDLPNQDLLTGEPCLEFGFNSAGPQGTPSAQGLEKHEHA